MSSSEEQEKVKSITRPMKENLRIDEVAICLDVSVRTVRRLLDDGDLIGFKVRRGSTRVPHSEIDRYIKRQIEEFQKEKEFL